jgi:hypothetical protein
MVSLPGPRGTENRKGYLFHIAAILLAAALLAATAGCTREASQPPPPKDIPFVAEPSFQRDILPILEEFCVKCHSPADAHAELRLNSYENLLEGGDEGPIISPGNPEKSHLIEAIKHLEPPEMPFHGEPLTPNRIKAIENWVRMGAPDN